MKSNFPKFLFLLSLILLVASSALFFFLYREIKSTDAEAEQLAANWQTEAKRRENMKTVEQSLKKVEIEKMMLETHFAKSSDVVPYLDMIEKLARDVGAWAEVLEVDFPKDNVGLVVQVHAEGSFTSLYKFITLLENSPYEMEFNAMDLKKLDSGDPEAKGESAWSVTLGVKLLTFVK